MLDKTWTDVPLRQAGLSIQEARNGPLGVLLPDNRMLIELREHGA
jgi:hypothetical protein